MNLQEVNQRIKNGRITSDQLDMLNPLYILLDLDKDKFCAMLDAVGVSTVTKKHEYYEKALEAMDERTAKDRYVNAKNKKAKLQRELEECNEIIMAYENDMLKLLDMRRVEKQDGGDDRCTILITS